MESAPSGKPEVLRVYGNRVDMVNPDGDVVPEDMVNAPSEADSLPRYWHENATSSPTKQSFDGRNGELVEALNDYAGSRQKAGLARQCLDGSREQLSADKAARRLRRSFGEMANLACSVCPLAEACELKGKLPEVIEEITQREAKQGVNPKTWNKLRFAVGKTPKGKPRSGYDKSCPKIIDTINEKRS